LYDLTEFFKEDFFETKKIVYLPVFNWFVPLGTSLDKLLQGTTTN
jgi:hypothetical protein